jgi:hypothetical protein
LHHPFEIEQILKQGMPPEHRPPFRFRFEKGRLPVERFLAQNPTVQVMRPARIGVEIGRTRHPALQVIIDHAAEDFALALAAEIFGHRGRRRGGKTIGSARALVAFKQEPALAGIALERLHGVGLRATAPHVDDPEWVTIVARLVKY